MNKIFSPSRFGKYFLHDLVTARNNFLVSGLILGCLPVVIFAVNSLFNRLITGSWTAYVNPVNQVTSVIVATIVASMVFPAKMYGSLTERRAGSSWLMMPASNFEKWLSMCLVCLLVLPVFLGVLLLGTDAALSALFPMNYGRSLVYWLFNANSLIRDSTGLDISINIPAIIFIEWAECILPFLLGAIFFRKSKVAKTFLALMLLGLVFSILSIVFAGNVNIDFNELQSMADSAGARRLIDSLNILISAVSLAYIAALLGLVFLRIKTLKH